MPKTLNFTNEKIGYVAFDSNKPTKSAQLISSNLKDFNTYSNDAFELNFISLYLPLYELIKWRAEQVKKFTPEFCKKMEKSSVQLKAQLDDSLLLCKIDSNFKRIENSNSLCSDSEYKKVSALFSKSEFKPKEIQKKISELNKKGANISTIGTAYNEYRRELGVKIDEEKRQRSIDASNKKAKSDNKKVDGFEVKTNLTVQQIDSEVAKFLSQLLKANDISETQYNNFKSSVLNKNKKVA